MGQMDRSNNHLLGNCMDGISLHFCSISFSRPIRSSMMSSKSSVYFCGLEGNDLICSRRCTNVFFFRAILAFTASHFVVADVGCIAFIKSLNIESMLPPNSAVKAAISSKFECNVVSSLGAVAMLLLLLTMAEGLLINGLGGSGSECFMLKLSSSKFECNVVSSLGAVAMLFMLLAMAEGLLINGLGGCRLNVHVEISSLDRVFR